jgi:serine/threonine-protein kinase
MQLISGCNSVIPTEALAPVDVPPENPSVGSIWVQVKDDMTMVYVPSGEFEMGSEDGADFEKLVHNVYLDAFWIDQTEVTNAMYAGCVADGACDSPNYSSSYTRESYYGNAEFDKYPVIYISWEDANAYCAWAERRLPTEAEWEKAAGWNEDTQNKMIYPWGDTIDESYANYKGNVKNTTAVGSYEKGKSFYGAYDMGGNVSEWVADWYDENYYASSPASNPLGPDTGDSRVLRGGSWYYYVYDLRSANRDWSYPSISNLKIGFRCARDASP